MQCSTINCQFKSFFTSNSFCSRLSSFSSADLRSRSVSSLSEARSTDSELDSISSSRSFGPNWISIKFFNWLRRLSQSRASAEIFWTADFHSRISRIWNKLSRITTGRQKFLVAKRNELESSISEIITYYHQEVGRNWRLNRK